MLTQTRTTVIGGNGLHHVNTIKLLDGSIFEGQSANDAGDPAFDYSFSSFPVIPALANVDFGEIMTLWRQSQEG